MKQKTVIPAIMFLTGGVLYGIIEVCFRGYTHPTMIVAGGLCAVFISYLTNTSIKFYLKVTLSALFITFIEFLFGCVFNLALNMNVWDYSDQPFNILGQVCPLFLGLWAGLSVLALHLVKQLQNGLKNTQKIMLTKSKY